MPTTDPFAAGRAFLRLEGRLLERRLFATVFEGAAPSGVVGAVNFRFQPIGHATMASWCLRAAAATVGEGGTVSPSPYSGVAFVDGHPIGQLAQIFRHLAPRRQIAALPAG